jgi:hypothetical protein
VIDSDFTAFTDLWNDANELSANGKTVSQSAMNKIFQMLEKYSLKTIEKALFIHGSRKSRYAPTPFDIIEIIDSYTNNKHIQANEAWAIAEQSMSDQNTVIITSQIIEARMLAQDVYEKDPIAARMTFKDAYDRIIARTDDPPRWFISPGYDKSQKVLAIAKGVALGRINKESAEPLLLEFNAPSVNIDQLKIGHSQDISFSELVDIAHNRMDTNKANELKQKWQQVREKIGSIDDDDGIAERHKKRLEFESIKASQLEKVREKLDILRINTVSNFDVYGV